jgi:hypothetical protein
MTKIERQNDVKTELEREALHSLLHWWQEGRDKKMSALKVPRQFVPNILVEADWTEGKASGSEEGRPT